MNLNDIKILILHPFGRAGSLFFQSLMDMHSQILILPDRLKFYNSINENIKNIEWELDKLISKCNNILFDMQKGYYGSKRNNIGFVKNKKIGVDKIVFKKNFFLLLRKIKLNRISRKEFFIVFHAAYRLCYDKNFNLKNIKYILYHPHKNIDELSLLKKDFKKVNIIILIRDPRQNFYSNLKLQKKRQFFKFKVNNFYFYFILLNLMRNFLNTSKILKIEKAKFVKFVLLNDIHKNKNLFLKKLCNFLEIKREKTLEKTTINNTAWLGNSTIASPTTFNKNFRDDWKNNIDNKLIWEIEYICKIYFKTFKKKFTKSNIYKIDKIGIPNNLRSVNYIYFIFNRFFNNLNYLVDKISFINFFLIIKEFLSLIKKLILLFSYLKEDKKKIIEGISYIQKKTNSLSKKFKVKDLLD
jgi:hypothetical protein